MTTGQLDVRNADLNWERFRSELRAVEAALRSDVGKQLAEMDKRFDVVTLSGALQK